MIQKSTSWWLVLLMALAALLRFYKINSPLWLDEVVALVHSYREPFRKILTTFPGHFPHPLYEALAHAGLALFGETPFAIRLAAAVFGIAGVFMFYKFSRRLSDENEALLGTALFAVSYHDIYFSQDARGYTLYLFLALVATYLFLDFLQKARWQTAAGYIVVAALAAYAQTAGLTLALAQTAVAIGAFSLGLQPKQPGGARPFHFVAIFALTTGFVLLLYTPIIHDSLAYVSRTSWNQPGPGLATRTVDLVAEIKNGLRLAFSNWPILGGGIVVCIFGALDFLRRNPMVLALYLAPLFVCAAVMAVTGIAAHARYLLLLLILAYLTGTRGLVLIGRALAGRFSLNRWILRAAAVGLVVLAALPLREYYAVPKQDFIGALQQTRAMASPEDRIVAAPLAGVVYRIYYAPGLPEIKTLSDLMAEELRGRPLWVITTFERVEARQIPDLLARLHNNYQLRRVLPASTGDGEMRIYFRPVTSAAFP